MAARNMRELEKLLGKQVNKAMNVASQKMLTEMQVQTYAFYTKGKPKRYERTGALGDSPRITHIMNDGNQWSYFAYLDDTHRYTTGPFAMGQVLERAESTHFRSGILGKPKFWYNSTKRFETVLRHTMKSFFK